RLVDVPGLQRGLDHLEALEDGVEVLVERDLVEYVEGGEELGLADDALAVVGQTLEVARHEVEALQELDLEAVLLAGLADVVEALALDDGPQVVDVVVPSDDALADLAGGIAEIGARPLDLARHLEDQ